MDIEPLSGKTRSLCGFSVLVTVGLWLASPVHGPAQGLKEWTQQALTSTNDLHDVAYGDGVFAAVGHEGILLISTNGVRWESIDSPTAGTLHAITYGAGRFVVVGLSGTIIQSGRVTQPRLMVYRTQGEQATRITLSGNAGSVYRLQVSTNIALGTWSDLLTLTNEAGDITVTDFPGPEVTQKFYRAMEQPR